MLFRSGFQLDLKLAGVPLNILNEAVDRATTSRAKILEFMTSVIAQPRTELAANAPRIETLRINPDKIGMLIGPGGKNVKGITAETGAEVNISDDGTVRIYCSNAEGMARAKELVEMVGAEVTIGKTYSGKVVSIKDFGAFVEVLPGQDGLVHISELSDTRVNKTEDVVKVGQIIQVKCIGVDDKGRVKLSRRAVLKDLATAGTPAPAA